MIKSNSINIELSGRCSLKKNLEGHKIISLIQLRATVKQLIGLEYKVLNEKARIRKLDNNNKFNIGGLVIKAKLDDLYHKDKAILLGAFLYIKMMLESDNADNYIETFKELGQAVFDKDLQRKAALKELKKNA